MTDIEMTLDDIHRRQAIKEAASPEAQLTRFTEGELQAFIDSPVWKYMQFRMAQDVQNAQNIRDSELVTRDSERIHLGVQIGIRAFLQYPQEMMNNHKQTETEENQQ